MYHQSKNIIEHTLRLPSVHSAMQDVNFANQLQSRSFAAPPVMETCVFAPCGGNPNCSTWETANVGSRAQQRFEDMEAVEVDVPSKSTEPFNLRSHPNIALSR